MDKSPPDGRLWECDFSGWDFPKDPEEKWFKATEFASETSFKSATFAPKTSFEDATFRERTYFMGATFKFETSFKGTTFRSETIFKKVLFGIMISFKNAKFEGRVSFYDATFGEEICFEGTTFSGATLFNLAKFKGNVFFSEAHFKNEVTLTATHCGGEFRLCGWGASNRKFARFDRLESAKQVFRFAKQIAQDRGNYIMAGEYHYAEHCAIEKELTGGKWWIQWLFGNRIFGYGEKPSRPVIAGLVVVLVCAFFYWCGGLDEPEQSPPSVAVVDELSDPSDGAPLPRVCDPATICEPDKQTPVAEQPPDSLAWQYCKRGGTALYFSVVTFTTLGYGDYQPKTPFLRFIAMTEALLGAGLMATFVVVLSRKYVR